LGQHTLRQSSEWARSIDPNPPHQPATTHTGGDSPRPPPDPARRHRRRGGARRRRWPEARTEARPTRATPSPTTSAGTPSSARASAPPCGTYLLPLDPLSVLSSPRPPDAPRSAGSGSSAAPPAELSRCLALNGDSGSAGGLGSPRGDFL
jgi:hypothetical protein